MYGRLMAQVGTTVVQAAMDPDHTQRAGGVMSNAEDVPLAVFREHPQADLLRCNLDPY